MKTTIEISAPLFEKTKQFAQRHGLTFRAITEQALRQLLAQEQKKSAKFKLRKQSFKGKGLAVGVREGDWATLRDAIYEGRGG